MMEVNSCELDLKSATLSPFIDDKRAARPCRRLIVRPHRSSEAVPADETLPICLERLAQFDACEQASPVPHRTHLEVSCMSANIRIENGVIIGTTKGKYDSKNPLARKLVHGFDDSVMELARRANPKTILEVGCGEGHVLKLLLQATDAKVHATDISATCVAEARSYVADDTGRVTFGVDDILQMRPRTSRPDLVVCCEVLEHLHDPKTGLEALVSQKADYYLLSVPREPLWRILNFCRGAYMKDWGNSPGHFQHWSRNGFLKFISPYLDPIAVKAPLPWTMVLATLHGR
jgi:SAM-dependent methyltransferase